MMANRSEGLSPKPVDAALTAATSAEWSDRLNAVRFLAGSADSPRVLDQLVRSLDDLDTAVVEEAVEALVRAGGSRGLHEVLQHLAVGEDDVGYHIRDRLVKIWLDGFPILDWLREILRDEPTSVAGVGALEIVDLLESK